jgi:ethanolamine permease
VALVAGLLVDPCVILGAAIIYGLHIADFALYSRHHLVSQAPEEEFAAIQRASAIRSSSS